MSLIVVHPHAVGVGAEGCADVDALLPDPVPAYQVSSSWAQQYRGRPCPRLTDG